MAKFDRGYWKDLSVSKKESMSPETEAVDIVRNYRNQNSKLPLRGGQKSAVVVASKL